MSNVFILEAHQVDWQTRSLIYAEPGAGNNRALILDNSLGKSVSLTGLEIIGQQEGMALDVMNRGTDPIELLPNNNESLTAHQFADSIAVGPDSSVRLYYNGLRWESLQGQVGDTIEGVKTFTDPPIVPDEAYGPTWDTKLEPPTKNAVYDELERLRLGVYAMEFPGWWPGTVEVGNFYPLDTSLGSCLYECYTRLADDPPPSGGRYDWSAGFGGAHGMLRCPFNGNFVRGSIVTAATNATPIVITTETPHGLASGAITYIRGVLGNTAANAESPVITVISPTTFSINGSVGNGAYTSGGLVVGTFGFGGTGIVEFGADDAPRGGQWAYSATGVWVGGIYGSAVYMYYDGVPVGAFGFNGTRVCPSVPGNAAVGYMGGSDHSGMFGRLAQYRIFEGTNPHEPVALNGTVPFDCFTPELGFGAESNQGYKANLLFEFLQPAQIVVDKSAGWPTGNTHAGRPRGASYGLGSNIRSSYPAPAYVMDPSAPHALGGQMCEQPLRTAPYVPAAAPEGALVFDSIQRPNSTYAYDRLGGIGSTESGSLGPLVWRFQGGYDAPAALKPFGILNEQFVFLAAGIDTFARVPVPQTNLDIRVSRKAVSQWGAGVATGLMFRYVDDGNYCFVCTRGVGNVDGAMTSQMLCIGQVVGYAITAWAGNTTPCPATNWEVLSVRTKSNGDYSVHCDATQVLAGNNATHAAGTGAGISLHGNPGYYGVGHSGAGLRMRYRNFTVFPNP